MQRLFDLVLVPADDGGLAAPDGSGVSLSAEQIAGLVREAGGVGCDLRVLVADGGRYRTVLRAVAQALGRDVLVAPAGADIFSTPAVDGVDTRGEVVPVDRSSGHPVDWLVIQPADRATTLPGWFDLVGGLVLDRTGMVMVPLPGGVALATQDDFVHRRAAAAMLAAGHPGLTTVAVGVSSGGFVVGHYDGAVMVHDGGQLAADLSALPLYGADLRLWLAWPADRAGQRRLRDNLEQLAQTTGAVVWAPSVGGRAEIVDGCRDLVALVGEGEPTGWQAYQAPPAAPAHFEPGADGRLVPTGGFVLEHYPGVAVVSVLVARARRLAAGYARIRARSGLSVVDLAVLDDGRLAARCADGTLFALGPGQLRRLLGDPARAGADVALLAEVPPERIPGLADYLWGVDLGCDVFIASPGSEVTVANGMPRAMRDGEPSTWHRFAARDLDAPPARWRGVDGWLVQVPEPAPRPAPESMPPPALEPAAVPEPEPAPVPAAPVLAPAAPILAPASAVVAAAPELAAVSVSEAVPLSVPSDASAAPGVAPAVQIVRAAPSEGVLFADETHFTAGPFFGPRLDVAARTDRGHGLDWLPERLQVNAEQFHLYLATAWPPHRVLAEGMPSPNLFAVGRLDPVLLAAEVRGGYLLRIAVGARGAVDVPASEARPPSDVLDLFRRQGVYLLPAGWLHRSRVVAGLRVDTQGQLEELNDFASGPLMLRCLGARHGAPGLPNEVTGWPRSRIHASDTRYALIPRSADEPLGGCVVLHRRRPPVQPDRRVVQLRVGRGRAIDVAATASRLATLTSVRSSVDDLRSQDIELVLPRQSYPSVVTRRLFVPEGDTWRRQPLSRGQRLRSLVGDL